MGRNHYYHQRFFSILYNDMARRLSQYRAIQQMQEGPQKTELARRFLREQALTLAQFISQEKYIKHKLREGLNRQKNDIESWWKRVRFRRIRRNCLNNFSNLIRSAKKVEIILADPLNKGNFDGKGYETVFADIENELKTIMDNSDDDEIKKYGLGILGLSRRSRSIAALTILFLSASAIAAYYWSNYHFEMINTQTAQARFVADDITSYDWAQGAHKSYGFHTMLERIADAYQNHENYTLSGLKFTAGKDQRYGNKNANALKIHQGAAQLLPAFMRKSLGENIFMEVASLNNGELEVEIRQDNESGAFAIDVMFVQDRAVNIGANSYGFSNAQLEEMYHFIRQGIEARVNAN